MGRASTQLALACPEIQCGVPHMTRRDLLVLAAAAAPAGWAQQGGMASRGVRPQPRGKPSGLPFHARFTDVASHAGLRETVVYGPPDRMDYILESMGCGGVQQHLREGTPATRVLPTRLPM